MITDQPELEAVRRLLLPPDEPDAVARQAAWSRVEAELRARPRRLARLRPRPGSPLGPTRSRRVLVAVAAVAGAAAVAVPALMPARESARGLPSPASAAAMVLARAAEQLRDDRPLAPGEARVVRVDMRRVVTREDARGRVHGFVLPRRWEDRVTAAGRWRFAEQPDGAPEFADAAARAAYERAFGPYVPVAPKPPIGRPGGPHTPDPEVLGLTPAQVLALPAEPAALAARLRRLRAAQPSDLPHDVAGMAVRLLVFGPTPPRVRAALAEVLARVDGTTVAGHERVGDRPGVALTLPARRRDRVQEQLVLDERTGELLASRTLLTAADRAIPGSGPGTVLDVRTYTTAIVGSFSAPGPAGPAPRVGGPVPPG